MGLHMEGFSNCVTVMDGWLHVAHPIKLGDKHGIKPSIWTCGNCETLYILEFQPSTLLNYAGFGMGIS